MTADRQITEADVRAFAELSGDRNPIHLDRDGGCAGGVRGPDRPRGARDFRWPQGWQIGWHSRAGTLVALVGVSWRFRGAIYYGDQVTLHLRVASRRATGNPARGLVTLTAELKNQRGEVVQEGEFVELIARRTPSEGQS